MLGTLLGRGSRQGFSSATSRHDFDVVVVGGGVVGSLAACQICEKLQGHFATNTSVGTHVRPSRRRCVAARKGRFGGWTSTFKSNRGRLGFTS